MVNENYFQTEKEEKQPLFCDIKWHLHVKCKVVIDTAANCSHLSHRESLGLRMLVSHIWWRLVQWQPWQDQSLPASVCRCHLPHALPEREWEGQDADRNRVRQGGRAEIIYFFLTSIQFKLQVHPHRCHTHRQRNLSDWHFRLDFAKYSSDFISTINSCTLTLCGSISVLLCDDAPVWYVELENVGELWEDE